LERALQTARETTAMLTIQAGILAQLAEACLGAAQVERAQRLAEEAIECGRRRQTPVLEANAHLALARVLLVRRGADAKVEIEPARAPGSRPGRQPRARARAPHTHERRPDWAPPPGAPAARTRELQEAHRLFSAIGATGHAARLAKELTGSPR